MINCIIVEDEPLALEKTQWLVKKINYLNLVASFDNAFDAMTFLKGCEIDLIFLDINMDEFTGIQMLESTNLKSEVIITTAYPEYALKGYELNVTDYLIKPFGLDRFIKAVDKIHTKRSNDQTSNNLEFIFVKTENRLEKISFDDILYIEGMRDYRRIHTTTKRIMTLQSFTDFEQKIPSHLVARVHKSYMVGLSKIESIENNRIKIGKELIPISNTYRDSFMTLIKKD
tara:strand:- start:583 stop:1269 length:687 start_codon:yes stop_codon:yes gene_type:complete